MDSKKIFMLLLMQVGLFLGVANAQSYDKKIIPPGWKVEKTVPGHLDDNNLEDLVLILIIIKNNFGETDIFEDSSRQLLLLSQTSPGKYNVQLKNSGAILCARCGGMLGDPLQSIEIKNKVLIITHYGGSRDRWGMVHRYRFQQGDWYLIGATYRYDDNFLLCGTTNDINLNTREMIVKGYHEDNQKILHQTTLPIKPLPLLKTYNLETEGVKGLLVWGIKPAASGEACPKDS
ncbi:MAG: hypothetical protein HYU97_07465 [Deltaproteobacteria bacterium]|nr:hypothetical protein [Deltaproteobacteria bacterium]